MQLGNKTYTTLKYIAMIGLPSLATLALGLGQLYNWAATTQIVGTITLLNKFLGSLLGISTGRYNRNDDNFDGYLGGNGVDPDTGIPNLQLTVTTPPEEMLNNKIVRLKVGAPPPKSHAA